MRRIRLFATDLDGTLMRPDGTISERTIKAMRDAEVAGVEVVLATGRAKASVSELAQRCGFTGIAICSNGAVVVDVGAAMVTTVATIEADQIRASMDHIRALEPATVFAIAGLTDFVAEPEYQAICGVDDHHRDPALMDLSTTLPASGVRAVKLVARHPDLTSFELYARVAGSSMQGVELTYSGAPFIEMSAAGVSKARALATLCLERGIEPDEVAAAGDSHNDLAMLRWAGTSLAPSNALPEVLAVVDQVIPANSEDGVASYLEGLTRHDAAADSVEFNRLV